MSLSKENKYPEIRFKGFTEDWEQRKLGDVVRNIGTGKSKFKISKESSYTNYAVLGSTSIIGFDTDYDYEGNFILTARVGANAGTLYQYSGKVKITDNTVYIQGDNLSFLYSLLNNFNLKKLSFGTGQPLIKSSELKKITLKFPDKEEQIKIGSFFKQLDDTITLHQEKLDKLHKLKKGYLQAMFPHKEEVPKVRFANFSGKWKQRKWGKVMKVNSGRDYKHLEIGDIPVYGTGGYMLSVNEYLSNQDSIGIGRKGTIDKPQFLTAPFWTVDTLFYMTPLPNYDLRFLYSLTQQINWKKHDESTGVPSLSKVNIEKINQYFPDEEEQSNIGMFFQKLDYIISLHQRKLNELNKIKKAYMSNMFI